MLASRAIKSPEYGHFTISSNFAFSGDACPVSVMFKCTFGCESMQNRSEYKPFEEDTSVDAENTIRSMWIKSATSLAKNGFQS